MAPFFSMLRLWCQFRCKTLALSCSFISHRMFLSLNFFICIKQKSIIDTQKRQMILALLVVDYNCEAVSDSVDSLECFCLVDTVLALKL